MRIQTLLDLVEDSFMLHSNELQRTQKDGDTEKGCQKLTLQQKTVMMIKINIVYLLWIYL